ncbi:hypothetical protein E2542_SST22659 [Spatholobus suberectus]|nr:hypothetical protein E2542_SST22659 [Spatholobus suberectus]
MLLRCAAAGEALVSPFVAAFATPVLDCAEYDRRLRNLQMEKVSFLINVGIGIDGDAIRREAPKGDDDNAAVCEE